MVKRISSIILSLVLVFALSVTAFAAPDSAENESVVYLTNTDPNSPSLLGSEVFYNTYLVGAGSSLSVYSADSSNGYFTSSPGTSCIFQFTTTTTSISVVRVTIGGVSYSLYPSRTSLGNGMYSYYASWVADTATPYMIQIVNGSSSQIRVTAMSISY